MQGCRGEARAAANEFALTGMLDAARLPIKRASCDRGACLAPTMAVIPPG